MSDYTEFRIEARNSGRRFHVQVKGWFGYWGSGFMHTDYFDLGYNSKEDAVTAVKGYKNRITEVV